jgi:subtilase-type serine protease
VKNAFGAPQCARNRLLLSSAAVALLVVSSAAQAQSQDSPRLAPVPDSRKPHVVVTGPDQGHTPDSAVDQEDITGIGHMVLPTPGGHSNCTGTLINPRTVIFAAHCVNDMAADRYGTALGGRPIGFGFKADNNDALVEWQIEGFVNGNFRSNVANAFYNVNQVFYHPLSNVNGPDENFFEADVAIASLDAPTRDIPIWALLFSALPAPSRIDPKNGTGYHVTIAGYGGFGIGDEGVAGLDNRRRIAENILGMLGSNDEIDFFRSGEGDGHKQNVYVIDFDDPTRANPYDVNINRDDALPNEGLTAGGDSGGPLILDRTFDEKVLIGVLSGGGNGLPLEGAPDSGYGAYSFYQPLYLWWDWIAANNPYRYVAAKAGDGKWSDPNHWVTRLDPVYRVLDANGKLVAGIPNALGAGIDGSDPAKFGQICLETDDLDACADLKTREVIQDGQVIGSLPSYGNAPAAIPLPAATLANGLPGASGFVPDNIDPSITFLPVPDGALDDPNFDPAQYIIRKNARYFDVTLAAAGTTTLDTSATIDRLTITGAQSALNVAAGGSLTSLIDINQLSGMVRVDGTLRTPGDYFVLSGGVTGSGQIYTPFFTSTAGTIAPGTIGGIGTLTFNGNVILTSGTRLLMDLGANGASDKIAVRVDANAEADTTGAALIGGTIAFAGVGGYLPRAGDRFTLITAESGLQASLTSAPFSAILRPEFTVTTNSVTMNIAAGNYRDVITPASAVQAAYAQLLDQNRGGSSGATQLFLGLDLLDAPGIRSTLEGLAPANHTLAGSLAVAGTGSMANFYRDRSVSLTSGQEGGTLAVYGSPLDVAARATTPMANGSALVGDSLGRPTVQPVNLPEDVSAFVAGGYMTGDSQGMAGAGRDDFDGYFVAAGIEKAVDGGFIGLGLSYTDLDGTTAGGQRARGALYQGTLYVGGALGGGVTFDAQMTAGAFDTRTRRQVNVAGTSYVLNGEDTALVLTSDFSLARSFDLGAVSAAPRAGVRLSTIDFTPSEETGGAPALQYDLGTYKSVQSRVGLDVKGKDGAIRPYASAAWVHEYRDRPGSFGANFAGGVGPNALFALAGTDRDWAEVSGGLAIRTGAVEASLSADTSIARSDVSAQSYRATVRVSF